MKRKLPHLGAKSGEAPNHAGALTQNRHPSKNRRAVAGLKISKKNGKDF